MADLRLFYKETCPYCKKVIRFIEKHELDDKIEYVNIQEDPKNEEELVEKGGQGMVPCLFIDGKPMYESSDIIDYLDENYVK
ncbi:glutaredoxin family protein [Gallicola sp. Sow4_E12]|uniref:glutaredoxin family protein n=1 Tax=Gallicola sp. Sow4_E12 TaxID=3438785 RepID=UPI003F92D3CF